MKRNNLYISLFFLMALIGFSACKDNTVEEITSLQTDRAFSPTDLTSSVVNKTGVKLTWKAVNNAKTYTIEVFETADFSGTPLKSISNIAFTQVPYTVTGLAGDTQYSIRVKAIGEGVTDSKWITATVKTDAEQIFKAINTAKLTSNSVVLNWPAGEPATTITLTPGNITHTITAAEITAGEASITGLTGETLYTAKLLNGAKVRGTTTFTTLLDLGGAIPVMPTDNLAALMANAKAGDVFALFPGTYNINADVIVTNSISLKGAKPSEKPAIKGMVVRVKANAGLGLKDLEIDGTGSLNGSQAIIYDEASDNAYGNLSIENCVIKNYVKGLIYVNLKTLIESVSIKGNIISSIECNGGDFIDFRSGLTKTLNFSNNTVYASVLARDFFRMDPTGSTNFPSITSVITVSTNTLNGMCNGAANRLFYVRLAKHEIYFSKNIVANSGGILTNQASTIIVAANFTANNYFNAPTYMSGSATSGAKYDAGTFTTLNPGFNAPATGNFTISQTDLKANGIGDPRWRN
ncbi:fibronectin type III domain-containing protein [Pedobacter punctiformis]|uniref:Fibronectin type III domain-containing protein n=1 Tax=Pedobacter punctiformis TaxID=3004097 RepID=A0ABT4L5Z3_9SPHI|nr:fibronectin type III domain-containing protein [Pedobacter sp. HCMS5-2]MCZ4243337.1 fibronectin type III domain-containing protein [Pedobacter sp. HCMS5-2]